VILTSANGSDWIPTGLDLTDQTIRAAAYGNNSFLLAGDNGVILTSTDGMDWVRRDSGSAHSFSGATFGNGTFVIVSPSGVVARSIDGVVWHEIAVSKPLKAVSFGNGRFVAVSKGAGNDEAKILSSPDAQTWTLHDVSAVGFYCVTHGRDRFVVFDARAVPFVSRDGADWTRHFAATSRYAFDVTHAHGLFVAVGGEFTPGHLRAITVSRDGASWTASLHEPGKGNLRGVTYGNGWFVAVGDGGAVVQSDPVFSLAPEAVLDESGLRLTLYGEAGRSFRIQAATNLLNGDWTDVATFTSESEAEEFVDSAASSHPSRFYRVVSP
jgi:hypothetical protein